MNISWFGFSITFALIWWMTVFIVLAVGVKPAENVAKGNSTGAPDNPRIPQKLIITTVIALAASAAIQFILPYFSWLIV